MKKILFGFYALIFALLVTISISSAATVRDVRFEERISAGNEQISLYGVGLLKWKYLVKVYQVALYKPENIPVEKILTDIPKRLEYYFFVDMKASDFQDTGFQLMAQNIGEEKARSFSAELEKLNSFYRNVRAGQRYTLTYIPGTGLEMALDGEVLGSVRGSEFAAAYLSIWLGPDPVSKSLKEGMVTPLGEM